MLFAVFGDASVSQRRCNQFLTESEMESVHLSPFTMTECAARCGPVWPFTPMRFDKEEQKDRREYNANKINSLSEQAKRQRRRGQNTHIYFYNSGQKEMSMDKLESRDSQRQSTYWTESLKKNKWRGIDYSNLWQAWVEDRWRTEKMRCI